MPVDAKTPEELADMISSLKVETNRLEREIKALQFKLQLSDARYERMILILRKYHREAQQSLVTPAYVNHEFYRGMQVPLNAVLITSAAANKAKDSA